MLRRATPESFVGRKPLAHIREKIAWPLLPAGKRGVNTTNAGKSLFSLPSPYDSHEPIDGFPGTSLPVMTNVQAGS